MKFRIFLKSFKNILIDNSVENIKKNLLDTTCKFSGLISLPIKIKRFCVLRSPHVNKDSREHFEIRIYKKFFDITTISIDCLEKLLKTELPSGVNLTLKML
jgi:small subunit ribosomal protein S10